LITNLLRAKKSRNILAVLSVTMTYSSMLHSKKMPQRGMREASQ